MKRYDPRRAQAAIEYLLLLGVVAAVILGLFQYWMGRSRNQSNRYFDRGIVDIYGDEPVPRTGATNYP